MTQGSKPARTIQQIASDLLTKKLEFLGNKKLESMTGQLFTRDNTARDFLIDYLEKDEIYNVISNAFLDASDAVDEDPSNPALKEALQKANQQRTVMTQLESGLLLGSQKAEAEALMAELTKQREIPKLIPVLEKLAGGKNLSLTGGELKMFKDARRAINEIREGLEVILEMRQDPEIRDATHDMAFHGGAVEPGESIGEAVARKAGGEKTPDDEENLTHIQARSTRRDKLALAILENVSSDLGDILRLMIQGKGSSPFGGPQSPDGPSR